MRFSATDNNTHRNNLSGLLAIGVILAIGLRLGLPTLNEFPAYTHAWSQSDWYSIAVGYQQNGYDFFHPETGIYNKQFPGHWKHDDGSAITAVDFPIHNYIVALLMGLFGTSAPWVYRLWTLLCSLMGMWFLYLLARRLAGSTLKALLVVVLAMTSPVYAYYFNNFSASPPAIALVSAGLWAYVVYLQEEKTRYWNWAIGLLAMATLIRTSQAVVLVAVGCYETLRIICHDTRLRHQPWAFVLAWIAIGSYFLWNAHLRDLHGSLFLNELMPARNWGEVHQVFEKINSHWRYSYFSHGQQVLMGVLLLLGVVAAILTRRRAASTPRRLSLGWFVTIWWVGELLFATAMLRQYIDHDYYFLDSFYLPTLVLLAFAIRPLKLKPKFLLLPLTLLLILVAGALTNNARHQVQGRIDPTDRAYQCARNYDGSDTWLDAQGVSREAKMLAVFSYPQNTPFIQMGRKGYSLMWLDPDIIDSVMHFPFDYIVIEDYMLRQQFSAHQYLLGRLDRVASNGRISLCTLCDSVIHPTADHFFATEGYVLMSDGHFTLDGESWFPLMLNYKAFIEGDRVVPAPWYTGNDVREHFDTIASWGFNAVRVCLDVLPDDIDTALAYAATRRIVQQADSAGLHVMLLIKPPLDRRWEQYATGLMQRLSDQPALWAYDLMNEPLYFDPADHRDKADAVRVVSRWRDMVRRNAPHQLFTVATAEPIEVFKWDPSMLPVDFIEMHTYHPLRVQAEMWWYSHYCGKPWMVGETGLPADGDSVSYDAQDAFMYETYRYARVNGAIGYGWWEFQDCPDGVNFEAKYTGLRDSSGRRKPTVDMVKLMTRTCLGVLTDTDCQPPVNYSNMLAYQNLAVTGTVVDEKGHPVEGAVVRGWNADWSVGMNTYSDSAGRFRLVSNDRCIHFEVSAPGYSTAKFDRHTEYPAHTPTPDRTREYQQIPLLGWGDQDRMLPCNKERFAASTAADCAIGDIKLKKIP